jgi:C1A family cysteine protease
MNKYTVISVLAIVGALIASTYLTSSAPSHTLITRDEAEVYVAFEQWMLQNGKHYREEEEKVYRFLKFRENYAFIKAHNARHAAGKETFEVAVNHFADMDVHEFKSIYNRKREVSVTKQCNTKLVVKTDVPDAVDWAGKAVAPVRNQGNCGSCWAFSATGALEGLRAIETGKIDFLSPQQLVDCAGGPYENEGCNGGEMDAALWYVIDNGIALDSAYPYKGTDGKCAYKPTMKAYGIKDCAHVEANKTAALKSAVATQPVSIAVEADTLQFQFYSKGVFSGKCGTDLDHGITLTGYGTLDGKDFWKCKNSWGPTWGLSGYILIARDSNDGPGQCGILMDNVVPLN